ncbi:DMT family transporter [Clostridium sp.]|uniref:DMT family transporter n=1 Tax=Clostridium sp. TaxID=1506 RepID=UPI002FC593F4
MNMNLFTKGMVLSVIGAALWGISGTFGQFLFVEKNFTPQWLVTIRLLLAGFIMLIFSYKTNKNNIFKIWTSKKDSLHLLIFSIIGMMPVQYTYFVAIKYSNAATATILQYLGPIIIIIYISIRYKKLPNKNELIAVIFAMIGIFILSTHGDINSLAISPYALFFGLASAFALAFYTLNPVKLLEKWDSSIVIGWSMLIGGIFLSFIHNPFKFNGVIDTWSILCLLFVIIFGTLIAFFLYLNSIKYIGATKASLFACVEPLSAAFFSIAWLNIPFETMDWIGFVFILLTVFILSFSKHNN